jgi:hypothetical protein
LLELGAAPASPLEAVAKPAREARRTARRGAIEISLPSGAKVSLDADVDAEALRRVLFALASGYAPVRARRERLLGLQAGLHATRFHTHDADDGFLAISSRTWRRIFSSNAGRRRIWLL